MLAAVLRLPAPLLRVLVAAGLLAHAGVVFAHYPWSLRPAAGEVLSGLLVTLGVLLAGRLVLSFLPPGDVGGHSLRELPTTLAVSLALGAPLVAAIPAGNRGAAYVAGALGVGLAFVRWITLPAAMVPRHRVAVERTSALELVLAWCCAAWVVLLPLSESPGDAGLFLAGFVFVHHALASARRARLGRHALFALGVLIAATAPRGAAGSPALGLAMGASFLVPWIRRADRRAGLLSACGFGSLFWFGLDPLALLAAPVFVLASHPRQRRFALVSFATIGATSLALSRFLAGGADRAAEALAHRRMLWPSVLREQALDGELWGLAWPLVGAALVLGLLSFPWRAVAWQPGTIEEPRREVRALTALLGLALLALSLPASRWFEQDALATLFPLCALLAGLLLIPPGRVAG